MKTEFIILEKHLRRHHEDRIGMNTNFGDLARDSADIAGDLQSHPHLSEEAQILLIRWQMSHTHELRKIQESLARLEAALVDARATGAEK